MRKNANTDATSKLTVAAGSDVTRIARNRQALKMLEFLDWNKLKQRVDEIQPDIIVYLPRKLPRVSELLQWKFPKALIISDYAIPWIAPLAKNKRIAVIDDSVSEGTSLLNTWKKVRTYSSDVHVFAVAGKNSFSPEDFRNKYGMKVSLVYDFRSEDDYKEFTHKVMRAMALLAKPHDVDFPSFTVHYNRIKDRAYHILWKLEQIFGPHVVHDTSAHDTLELGLARITVDMNAENFVNHKLRIYLDDATQTAAIVPIAANYSAPPEHQCQALRKFCDTQLAASTTIISQCENFAGETRIRCNQFIASLEFGLAALQKLEGVFKVKEAVINHNDALMLFGPEFADKVKSVTARKAGIWKLPEPVKHKNPEENDLSLFWASVKEGGANHDLLRDFDFSMVRYATKESIFLEFFQVLAWKKLGEEDPATYAMENYIPSLDAVIEAPYLRLLVGPTFGDLLHIFAWLWGKAFHKVYSLEAVRFALTDILDTCVDRGCVIPVISKQGKRVYRKGEAPPYDLNFFYALRVLYEESGLPTIAYPWDMREEQLTSRQRETLRKSFDAIEDE